MDSLDQLQVKSQSLKVDLCRYAPDFDSIHEKGMAVTAAHFRSLNIHKDSRALES
jgi:hypothetical protein